MPDVPSRSTRTCPGLTSETLAFAAVVLVAAVVRFYRLDFQVLWCDETFSYLQAGHPWNEVHRAVDAYPPLYIYVLKLVTGVFGTGEWALRLPSAFFGTLTVALFFRIAARWFDLPAAFWASLILAGLPFHVFYSQEARMYAMTALEALVLLYLWEQAMETHRRRYWAGFVACAAAGLYTHYWFLFLVVSLGIASVFFAARGKLPWRTLVITAGVIILFFIPWVPRLLEQNSRIMLTPNAALSPLQWIAEMAYAFTGTRAGQDYHLVRRYAQWVGVGLGAFLLLFGLTTPGMNRRATRLFWAGGIGTVGLALATACLFKPVLHIRYFIITLPAFLFAAAPAFSSERRWVQRASIAAVIGFFFFASGPLLRDHLMNDNREAVRKLMKTTRALAAGRETGWISDWYLKPLQYYAPEIQLIPSVSDVGPDTKRVVLVGREDQVKSVASQFSNDWAPGYQNIIDDYHMLALDRR